MVTLWIVSSLILSPKWGLGNIKICAFLQYKASRNFNENHQHLWMFITEIYEYHCEVECYNYISLNDIKFIWAKHWNSFLQFRLIQQLYNIWLSLAFQMSCCLVDNNRVWSSSADAKETLHCSIVSYLQASLARCWYSTSLLLQNVNGSMSMSVHNCYNSTFKVIRYVWKQFALISDRSLWSTERMPRFVIGYNCTLSLKYLLPLNRQHRKFKVLVNLMLPRLYIHTNA